MNDDSAPQRVPPQPLVPAELAAIVYVVPPKPPLPGTAAVEPDEPERSGEGDAAADVPSEADAVGPEIEEAGEVESDILEPEVLEPEVLEPEVLEAVVLGPAVLESEELPSEDLAPEDLAPEDLASEVFESDVLDSGDVDPEVSASELLDPEAFDPERGLSESHSDAPAVRVRGLVKSYGGTAVVDGIDLTVPPGIFYGLVGPNGAGKTTTLAMIAGLLAPDGGSIEIAGVDLGRDPRHARGLMGVLPDRLRTFDRLTGRQLLYYYGVLRGMSADVVAQRTADLARAFDLDDALGRTVSDYSAGMTKKVMLAGAMIHAPRLLVLDEPFEAVDPVSSEVILGILQTYVDHGGTVVLSTHGMDMVEQFCARAAILVGGQVLAEGTVDEVRSGRSLHDRFVELSGGLGEVEGLEWLHTFSG